MYNFKSWQLLGKADSFRSLAYHQGKIIKQLHNQWTGNSTTISNAKMSPCSREKSMLS